MKPLSIIVAMAENGVIGDAGGLPWDLPEDRAHFERETRGHAVVLGRRTWDETGAPLEGRTTIVVSSSLASLPGAYVARTLAEGIELARRFDPEPFVIGGVRLFEEAMPLVTDVYLTRVPGSPRGDTVLRLDLSAFELVQAREGAGGVRFETYRREPRLGRGK